MTDFKVSPPPEPDLPPAGYKRREELAQRQDALEEAAEIQYADRGAINPAALEPDREIQHDIQRGFLDLDVGGAYIVKWVNFASQHGTAIWQAKYDGWEVVTPDMVNNLDRSMAKEDNTIRVGDVLAMRMRKDRHLMMERRNREKALRQQFGAEAELHELADKHSNAFSILDEAQGQGKEQFDRIKRRSALRMLGNRMKKGTIPGVPIQ